MKTTSLTKLHEIIDSKSRTPVEETLLRDIFAISCYLSLKGESVAAKKLRNTLFSTLGRDSENNYFSEIEAAIEGNERKFASEIFANNEINNLFKTNAS